MAEFDHHSAIATGDKHPVSAAVKIVNVSVQEQIAMTDFHTDESIMQSARARLMKRDPETLALYHRLENK